MKFVSYFVVLSLFFSSAAFTKTQVQKHWIQVKPVSADHIQIQICTDYECLIVGKPEGYTSEDIMGIREVNAIKINAMTGTKWLATIGIAVIGSYLYRIGRILASITFGAITYQPIRGFDERISARQTFQNMPGVLSNESFEITPEQFVQLVQGLKDAVESYDDCIQASVNMGGPPDLEYCRTGQVPGQFEMPWGY